MKHTYCHLTQRESNSYLMDDFHHIIKNHSEFERLNAYRLHLKVLRLSDITYIQGNRLINNILLGYNNNLSTNNLHGSLQPSPNKYSWLIWSRTITKLYYINEKFSIIKT